MKRCVQFYKKATLPPQENVVFAEARNRERNNDFRQVRNENMKRLSVRIIKPIIEREKHARDHRDFLMKRCSIVLKKGHDDWFCWSFQSSFR